MSLLVRPGRLRDDETKDVTSRHAPRFAGSPPLGIPSPEWPPGPFDLTSGRSMTSEPFAYRLETPADAPEIDALHEDVFGPGRFARAAFRLREGVPHDPRLSFVALTDERLIASVRLTPIRIGVRPALLLGPLVVKSAFKGRGAGKSTRPHGNGRGKRTAGHHSSSSSATSRTTVRSAFSGCSATRSRCRRRSTRTGFWSRRFATVRSTVLAGRAGPI